MFDIKNTIRNKECELCPLFEGCRSVCNSAQITGEKALMIVMDYPSYEDDKNNTQFQSKREQVLMSVLDKVVKADIKNIHLSYLVRCRPADDNPPEMDHVNSCVYYLEEEILRVKPKVILTLGDFTMKGLIGKTGIMSHRGSIHTLQIDDFKVDVIPTLSPSFIERSDHNLKKFAEDIQKAYYKAIDFVVESSYADTTLVTTLEGVEELLGYIEHTGVACFDFETTGLDTFAEDFEATGLAISFQIGSAYFIPMFHAERCFSNEDIQWILEQFDTRVFANENIRKIAHNAKFDMHVAAKYGILQFKGRIDDTMLKHHLLDETKPHGLKDLVTEYFPQFSGYEDEVKKYKWDAVPLRVLAPYAGTDADLTLRLDLYFEMELLKDERLYTIYRNLTMPANKALFWAEHEGMLIDKDFLQEAIIQSEEIMIALEEKMMSNKRVKAFIIKERELVNFKYIESLNKEIKTLEAGGDNKRTLTSIENRKKKINDIKTGAVDTYKGLNLASPAQLGRLLYETHGFNFKMPYVKKARKNMPATGKEYLEEFSDRSGFIENLLLLRSIQKITGTYFKGIYDRCDKNNRIHTSFLIHGTTSGRLSSQDPNLQNLPSVAKLKNEIAKNIVAMVKQAFIAPKGHKIAQLDFSQMELRLVGDFAQDEEMIRAYANNEDIHKVTGAKLANVTLEQFKQLPKDEQKQHRSNAKPANFGLIYGQSAEGYMNYAKLKYGVELTIQQATKSRDAFFKLYKRLPEYHEIYIQKARRYGYVRTLFGRRRRTPNINSSDKFLKGEDERVAVNSPIQGSGGEITVFSLVIMKDRLDPRVKIVNTIHDSIIPYIPNELEEETLAIMKHTAENPPMLEYFGKQMKSISLKVDFEISDLNWKDMKEKIVE